MASVAYPHIATRPNLFSGAPFIEGHRVRVLDIAVLHEREGFSPEEICAHFPGLTLGQVHGALAYYFDHRAEIQTAIADEYKTAEAFRQKYQHLSR